MPFKIFKNNIYYKYSDQLKNIENKDIYFSRDYIKRNYDKLVKQYNKKICLKLNIILSNLYIQKFC